MAAASNKCFGVGSEWYERKQKIYGASASPPKKNNDARNRRSLDPIDRFFCAQEHVPFTTAQRQQWLQEANVWQIDATVYLDMYDDATKNQPLQQVHDLIHHPSLLTTAEEVEDDLIRNASNQSTKFSPKTQKRSPVRSPRTRISLQPLAQSVDRLLIENAHSKPYISPKKKVRVEPLMSEEMRKKLQMHVSDKMHGDIWENEIRSRLARPLSATTFCAREEQLAHPQSAPTFQRFDALTSKYPYSNEAHVASMRIGRWYRTKVWRHQLLVHIRHFAVKVRYLRRFALPVLAHGHRRRRRASQIIQRKYRYHARRRKMILKPLMLQFVQQCIAEAQRRVVARFYLARVLTKWFLDFKIRQIEAEKQRKHDAWRRKCIRRIVAKTRVCLFVHRVWIVQWLYRKRATNLEIMQREVDAMENIEKQVRLEYDVILQTRLGKQMLKQEITTWRRSTRLQTQQSSTADQDDKASSLYWLRQCFRLFDLDGSGAIDLDEFQLMLSSMLTQTTKKRKLTIAQMRDLFESLDQDGNGTITFEEMAVWWQQSKAPSSSAAVSFLSSGLDRLVSQSHGLLLWLFGRKQQLEKKFVKRLVRKRAMEEQKRAFLEDQCRRDATERVWRCPQCCRRFMLIRDARDHTKHCDVTEPVIDCYVLAKWIREETLRLRAIDEERAPISIG